MIHFTDDLIKFMIQKMVKQLYLKEYATAPPTTTTTAATTAAAADKTTTNLIVNTGGGAGGAGGGMYLAHVHDADPAVISFVQTAVGNALKPEKPTGTLSSSSSSSSSSNAAVVTAGVPSSIWGTLAQVSDPPVHEYLPPLSKYISPPLPPPPAGLACLSV